MRICGVDPGAIFTGLAIWSTQINCFTVHCESEDPVVIWSLIQDETEYDTAVIVVEDYLGTGRRSSYSQRTTEVLGYIYNRAREEGIPVERPGSQARLANVANVPRDITGKDEISAAAHALSYRERNGLAT